MDSWMIPTRGGYDSKEIHQTMFELHEKLKATENAPIISKASLRCYKSWKSYERQKLINFDSNVKKLAT